MAQYLSEIVRSLGLRPDPVAWLSEPSSLELQRARLGEPGYKEVERETQPTNEGL
jgi:hypothetical protein